MTAWGKTTAKYGLVATVHGLNKSSVVMSGHTENKEVLSWRKWGKHIGLSEIFVSLSYFCWSSAINLNVPPKKKKKKLSS